MTLALVKEPWLDVIERSTNLHELETIVQKGKSTFEEIGAALLRILEAELYKSTHRTWEDYCQNRWGWSRQRAHQLIAAARMSTRVDLPPMPTERHARELARLPDAKQQELAFEEATKAAGGATPTVAQLHAVVDAQVGRKPPPRLQTRRTPRWFFDLLDERFGPFVLDAYASKDNALLPQYLTEAENGHVHPWLDKTFANPEFKFMEPPVEQALRQAAAGINSIMLGPVGCSQAWFHEGAIQGTIYAPDRRISYDMPDGTSTDPRDGDQPGADRDTMVYGFGPEHANSAAAIKRGAFRVLRLSVRTE